MSAHTLWPTLPEATQRPTSRGLAAVLHRVPDLTDHELARLAALFGNGAHAAAARSRALSPDLPWVVDVLACFDVCERLYAGEVGRHQPRVVSQALRAVRDAVAGAYGQAVLRRGDYDALTRPWRLAVGPRSCELPPGVLAALGDVRALAGRCHDAGAAYRWNELGLAAVARDGDVHRAAVERAHLLAAQTGRERAWDAVRRCATEATTRRCTGCGRRPDLASVQIMALAVDGACSLLVADLLDPADRRTLTTPLFRDAG